MIFRATMSMLVCLMFFGVLSGTAQAKEANGMFKHKVGAVEVIALQDTPMTPDASILLNASPEIVAKYLPKGTLGSVNAFVVRAPEGTWIVDTGFGKGLFERLAALQIKPEEVKCIVLTHLHGDHIGGLLKDGKAAFPNAKLILSKQEKDYWLPEKQLELNKDPQLKAIFSAYGKDSRISTMEPVAVTPDAGVANAGISIAPWLRAIAAFGHTPGHTIYLIESGKERLLLWGDLMHVITVQMPHPEVTVTYDVDPVAAAETRKIVLQWVVKNNIPIGGMHIPMPAMGTLSKQEHGYAYKPFDK